MQWTKGAWDQRNVIIFGVSDCWVKETVVSVVLFKKLQFFWDRGSSLTITSAQTKAPPLCTMNLGTWNGSDKMRD